MFIRISVSSEEGDVNFSLPNSRTIDEAIGYLSSFERRFSKFIEDEKQKEYESLPF